MPQKDICIIGLTGPSGAGKSSLLDVFAQYGCELIDCDRLAREVVQAGKPATFKLAEAFGADILLPDGSIDRSLLAARAFPTEQGRQMLNGITHPAVTELLLEEIEKCRQKGRHAVIDAPLLFEAGLEKLCCATVAVLASRQIRTMRIMQRDGISEQAAENRLNAQPSDEFYSSRATYTLYNDADRQSFFDAAKIAAEQILGI